MGPYGAKIETEKSTKSPFTKNTKRLCKSTCYALTNFELTSSRLLSLLSLTSITSAVTPQMLSKQKNSPHTTSSNHAAIASELDRNRVRRTFSCIRKYIAPRGKSISFLTVSFCYESWPFHQPVLQHSIGTARHQFFLPVGSLFEVNKHWKEKE